MTTRIAAIFENGMFRPVDPVSLPEGSRVDLTVITKEETSSANPAADMLEDIASLPVEGQRDSFSGRDHDEILYPREKRTP